MSYTHIKGMMRGLTKAGIQAEIWRDTRILLHGFGGDITAYITFDNPNDETWLDCLFGGCALRVFVHPRPTGDTAQWALQRRQDAIRQIGSELRRAEIIADTVLMLKDDE